MVFLVILCYQVSLLHHVIMMFYYRLEERLNFSSYNNVGGVKRAVGVGRKPLSQLQPVNEELEELEQM